MKELTQERLKQVLDYSPDTGEFRWKERTAMRVRIGAVAGGKNQGGYIAIRVDGDRYLAHRLAWLYVYGQWPKHEVDHINGNPADNRIANLRDVTHQVNVQNLRTKTSSSSTGMLGVGPKYNKWRARITVNGKPRTIGTYNTKDEASAAYVEAKRQLHAGCTI